MIYERPRFFPGGDRYIEVELGDEMGFELNFRVHSLVAAIRAAKIKGLVELIPELASLQISYDPDLVEYDALVREIDALAQDVSSGNDIVLESRLFYVPALYFDPWTAACIDDYRAKVAEKIPDPDYLCEINGLSSRREFVRAHSETEYWVAALGFWPGLCSLMPLDPAHRLIAPKYNPPRTWTPKGALGIGGGLTCIYPDQTPGGYQLFGRTPMPIWDREQRLEAFKDELALFRAGDRVRFIPIDQEEWDYCEALVKDGSYAHPTVTYQKFSLAAYRDWVIDKSEPAHV